MAGKHSGKFVLRVSSEQHRQLKIMAHKRGISLNQLCVERLTAPAKSEFSKWTDLIRKTYGDDHLQAILIYGSQARGDANNSSDLDLLIVFTNLTRPSRHLYEIWDDKISPHLPEPVNPSFVGDPLRSKDSSTSGLWLEIAIDGIMIWQSGPAVQNYLQRLRSEIAAGVYVRKYIHGQPFWSRTKHREP